MSAAAKYHTLNESSLSSSRWSEWTLQDFDFLFIEKCWRSSFDLGESMRVVLVATTEGEDKPLKYPTIFNSADLTIVTKMDLASPAEFDLQLLKRNVHKIRPGMQLLCVSVRTSQGHQGIRRTLRVHLRVARAKLMICTPPNRNSGLFPSCEVKLVFE